MRTLSTILILVAAAINLLPVTGVVSAQQLQSLYGVPLWFVDTNLVILLRHRAVLFAIVGGLLAASAFRVPLRPVAFAAGLVSMISFVILAWETGSYNAELQRVLVADVVALAALLGAAVLDYFTRSRAAAA